MPGLSSRSSSHLVKLNNYMRTLMKNNYDPIKQLYLHILMPVARLPSYQMAQSYNGVAR